MRCQTAVIGAGYIAVDAAGVLNALEVIHLLVRKDRPLRTFDKDIVDVLAMKVTTGPTLHTHANATEVAKNADSLTISLTMEKRSLLIAPLAIGRSQYLWLWS